MQKILITLLVLIAPFAVAAQGGISGKIIDSKSKENLGYVTVAVYPQDSTVPLTGISSDDDGNFAISNIKNGKYTVKFTFVGYMEERRNITIANKNINMGTIALKPDSKMLKEVVVTEQRSQMSFEIDKRVFTVDQNIASTGGSATDVLTDIPSVEVDNEGTISLRGSESVNVWINGRPAGLTADNRGDILQQMPAGSIEKIEVITNPSAKYSPEGTAGIINIVLKRDRKGGYYGSAQVGGNTQNGYNGSANINYSSGLLDAYVGVSARHMEHESGGRSNTEYLERGTYQNQINEGKRQNENIFTNFGLVWHPTANDDIYFDGMFMKGNGENQSIINTESGITNTSTPTDTRVRTSASDMHPTMFNASLGYTHRFGEGHLIDFSASHNIWQGKFNNEYLQTTTFANEITAESYQYQNNKNKSNDTRIELDYENKISENIRIEAGYSGEFSRDENPMVTYTDRAHTIIDNNLFNTFEYNQDTHALYATFAGRIDKLGYQVGLRGEYWQVKTRSIDHGHNSTPEFNKKDFFNVFPSAFVSYEISDGNEVQVNYTRRLRRPRGHQLNSLMNISDSTNISFGNPNLTAEYSNAYELNYIKNWDKHTLSLSGYYRTTKDIIERISYSENNVIYSTFENVASSQSAGLEIVSKNTLFKILSLTTTVNLFYYKLDDFKYVINNQIITGESDENFSWNARMTASVILPWSMTMQATGRYNAKRIVAQGSREPSYSVDLGLRKSFNDHWSLSINARDLLDSRGSHNITGDGKTYIRDAENWFGGRTVSATLTYSFGNMKPKRPTKKQMQNAAESYGDGGGDYEGEM